MKQGFKVGMEPQLKDRKYKIDVFFVKATDAINKVIVFQLVNV